jgi:hypothetical protein
MNSDTTPSTQWRALPSLAALLAAVAIGGLALWGVQPTPPKPRTAPPAEFSAQRAHAHLVEMCVETHPTGSQAALRVRQYIEQTVRSMGYEPEVQRHTLSRGNDRPPFGLSYIENVIVRIPGTNPSGAFLNMAHYDSVPYGLGASDDGAGCAAMLEILRALKQHPPLKNDLIFLFTDAEEAGLLGPRAFMQHPYFKDVKAVLNYEARGYYGPSMMFELSDENGWLIDQVAQSATRPIASSVMFDIAGRMPTTTDYEVLKRAGVPGMGLAYVGGIEYYHTQNDSPEKISLASLQHHGEYGLPIALHFGNLDLRQVRAPNVIYFDVLGKWLVRYPQRILPLLTALGLLLVLGALMAGIWREQFTIRGVLAGAMLHLAALLVVGLLVALIMLAGVLLNQEYIVYRTYSYLFGFSALTICVYLLFLRAASRRLSIAALTAGALLLWVPVMLVVSAYMPGGSYITLWPMAGAAIGAGLTWAAAGRLPRAAAAFLTLAGALPALIIITPLLYISVLSVTILPAPFWMANLILLLSVLTPLLIAVTRGAGLALPAAAAGIAVPLLFFATFGIRFTESTPKINHFCYGMNCTTGEAFWLSKETELDEWLANFFDSAEQRGPVDDFVYGQEGEFLRAPAPKADLPHADVAVLSDVSEGDMRELTLRVSSRRKAARMDIALDPTVDVFAASCNGIPLGTDNGTRQDRGKRPWRLRWQGLSYDGIELKLRLRGAGPVHMIVRETSFGVPPIPGINTPMRPANMVTRNNVVQFWDNERERFQSNALYTVKEFTLPASQ